MIFDLNYGVIKMIKIDLNEEVKKSIEKKHKEYIVCTSKQKLENYILEEDLKKTSISENSKKFLIHFFGDKTEIRQQKLIELCTDPNLENLISEYEKTFSKIYGFENRGEGGKGADFLKKEIKNILDTILNYEGFYKGKQIEKKLWNRHEFVVSLGIRVCPYCNRQYITSYYEDSEKTTADVDHYYPKSLYPFLQMNIYNMIPSCNVCNSKTKRDNDMRHLYPYIDSSESLCFGLLLNSVENMYSGVSDIFLETNGNFRAENSIRVFKLCEIYQAHRREAGEVLDHVKNYAVMNDKYYIKTMGIDFEKEIYNMWFDFMSKTPNDEPLIKLKQDIFKQLTKL